MRMWKTILSKEEAEDAKWRNFSSPSDSKTSDEEKPRITSKVCAQRK